MRERQHPVMRERLPQGDPSDPVKRGRLRNGDQDVRAMHGKSLQTDSTRAEHPVFTVGCAVKADRRHDGLVQPERLAVGTDLVAQLHAGLTACGADPVSTVPSAGNMAAAPRWESPGKRVAISSRQASTVAANDACAGWAAGALITHRSWHDQPSAGRWAGTACPGPWVISTISLAPC